MNAVPDISLARDILQAVGIVAALVYAVGLGLTRQITVWPRSTTVEIKMLVRRRNRGVVRGVFDLFMVPYLCAFMVMLASQTDPVWGFGCVMTALCVSIIYFAFAGYWFRQVVESQDLLVKARVWAAGQGDYQPQ